MKTKILSSFIFLLIPFIASAFKWHDDMIQILIINKDIDKNFVVERNEYNNKIKKASYSFVISDKDKETLDFISTTLMTHSHEATKFSYDEGKILMQIIEKPKTIYNYRFDKDQVNKNSYVLLISVDQSKE